MHTLTSAQYQNTVSDIFGDSITLGGRLPPDDRVGYLLSQGTAEATITDSGMEQYDAIARSIAGQILAPKYRPEFIECHPVKEAAPDEACARRFLTRIGRVIFRRPLTDQEIGLYAGMSTAATRQTKDFYSGLELALSAMLVSPQFLYREETAEPDPSRRGKFRLDSYSIATRLSFLLWNTTPDPKLLAAAESGKLETREGRAAQVARMLASPRLDTGVRAFFSDMLGFEDFGTLEKDTTLYPKFTSTLAAEGKEQTLRTLVHLLIDEKGDYRDIFTTRETFLTQRLASLYRVPLVSPDGLPDSWVPYDFRPSSDQSGIITQASFVALHSHPGISSPTERGKALRELLLCTPVPDPPPNVNFTLGDKTNDPRYPTMRALLTAHATQPMCRGCHSIMDPLGLTLENFDTSGAYRTTDHGVLIDASGELDGTKFSGPIGLGAALHNDPQATTCLVKRLYGYALGRKPTTSEREWQDHYLDKEFAADHYRVISLLRQLALSDAFYSVAPPEAHDIGATPSHRT